MLRALFVDLQKQERHPSTSFNSLFPRREEQRGADQLVPKSDPQQEFGWSVGADSDMSIQKISRDPSFQ